MTRMNTKKIFKEFYPQIAPMNADLFSAMFYLRKSA